MAHLKCICTVIAIVLAFIQRSNAVITDTTCTPGNGGTTTCNGVDANADCLASATKCACKANYFLSSDKTKCLQKITTVGCTPGDATAGTAACKKLDANSECKASGNMCTCNEGYTGTDSCTEDITGNTCTPGHTTNGDKKCQAVDPNADCPASTTNCACKADYFLGTDKTKCVQIITAVACTAGATGTTACQTIDANSECKTGGNKCTCKTGYKGTNSCTKVIGGTCAYDVDCTGSVANSECSTQKCKCKDNFIEESAICKKALGQACTKKEDCVSNTDCDNKVCKCSAGFTKTNGLCAAESSATSAWMASSLILTSLLIFLPRFICGQFTGLENRM